MKESLQHFFENSSSMMRLVVSLSLVLLAPRLFEKIKLPGVLGLIFAGTLFGPDGLQLFRENGQVLFMFATLGKLLLLFFSGMDIDFQTLRQNLGKSLRLATASFLIPAAAGVLVGFAFEYSLMTSLMIGILFSSHSIIAYPILTKLGLSKIQPVGVTIAATAITDILSLILFAICIPIHVSGFSIGPFLLQLVYILGFIPTIIFGFRWLGRTVFKRLGEDPAQQMLFLLLVVGTAAEVAELVNVEPIVGAFLAGLAVGTTLPNVGIRYQLDTLGNTLFIPAFFISLGVLIVPELVLSTIQNHFMLVAAICISVLVTKFVSAWFVGGRLRYSTNERALIGTLTFPQVSSTLAVALVAYESISADGVRLIDDAILNAILVLMVVSTVLGTISTEWLAKRMLRRQNPGTVRE